MDDLIEALTILKKYLHTDQQANPTNCEHDILRVCGVDPAEVEAVDLKRLEELSFHPDDEVEHSFYSFRFGGC